MEKSRDEKDVGRKEESKEQQIMDVQVPDGQSSRREKDVVPKKKKTGMKKKVKTSCGLTGKETHEYIGREEIMTGTMRTTKSAKDKKKESQGKSQHKTKQQPKSKNPPLKEKNIVLAPLLISLTSDDEEDKALAVLRRSARSKRQASRSLEESTDRSSDASLWIDKRKLRRVESATDTTDRADVTRTQTTQTVELASDGSLGSAINDKDSNTASQALGNKQNSLMSQPAQHASKLSATSQRKRPVTHLAKAQNPASCVQKSTQITAVPNAVHSAIAQAVSERQHLLSRSQAERYQRSTSDYGLSDIDFPTPSTACNDQQSSDSIRHKTRPCIGLLPLLFDRSLTTDDRANLGRKHVFLRAKKLAFEQLKWQRENEFQQQDLELLRYETEARQALARQELKIKRMCIRAVIIQPMISAGASVTDIVERLRML